MFQRSSKRCWQELGGQKCLLRALDRRCETHERRRRAIPGLWESPAQHVAAGHQASSRPFCIVIFTPSSHRQSIERVLSASERRGHHQVEPTRVSLRLAGPLNSLSESPVDRLGDDGLRIQLRRQPEAGGDAGGGGADSEPVGLCCSVPPHAAVRCVLWISLLVHKANADGFESGYHTAAAAGALKWSQPMHQLLCSSSCFPQGAL